MKPLYIFTTLVLTVLFMACGSGGGGGGGDEDPGSNATKIASINLPAGANTVAITEASTASAASVSEFSAQAASTSTGLAVHNGTALIPVSFEAGVGQEITGALTVRNAPAIKLVVTYQETANPSNKSMCLLKTDNSCLTIEGNPQRSNGFQNSPYFVGYGTTLYYKAGNALKSLDTSVAVAAASLAPQTIVYQSTVIDGAIVQFALNETTGEQIIADADDTAYKLTDNSEHDLDTVYSTVDASYDINPNLSVSKFFLPSGDGFLVKHGLDDTFIHLHSQSNTVYQQHAQHVAYWEYMNGINGYVPLTTNSAPSNCSYHTIAGNEVIICKPNEVFIIGDPITKKDINYSTHFIYNLQIVATSNYTYMSSDQPDESPRKLTKEDIFGEVSTIITTDYKLYKDSLTAEETDTSGDILTFCGTEYATSTEVSVKILFADTSPDIQAVPEACSMLLPI